MPCSEQVQGESSADSDLSKCEVCEESGVLKCSGCRRVAYCSKIHQRQHWTQHRPSCSPFRLHVDPVRGRCLVATRALQAGELILKERPLVVGPKLFSNAVCLGCGVQLDPSDSKSPYICRCHYPMCSSKCSASVWHKMECSLLCSRNEPVHIDLSASPNPAYIAITPLRCLLLLRHEQQSKNSKESQADDDVFTKRQLQHLQTHKEVRSSLEHVQMTEQQVLSELKRLQLKSATPEEINQVCGALDVNGFDTPLPGVVALLATASMLEHDCTPNTQRTFTDDLALQLWAAQRIGKGEHLTASYTDPLWGTGNRRYFLRQTKHFDCTCSRCSDPTEFGSELSTLKCPKCCGNSAADSDPSAELGADMVQIKAGMMRARKPLDTESEFACDLCDTVMTSIQVNQLIDKIGQQLINLERCDVTAAEKFIRSNAKHLSGTHFYMCDVKTALAMLIGKQEASEGREMTTDQCDRKQQLATELLVTLEKVNPGRVRLRGVLLYELQTAIMRKSQLSWQCGSMSRDQWISQAQTCLLYLQKSYDLLRIEPSFSSEFHLAQRASVEMKALSDVLDHLNSQSPNHE